MVTSNSLSLTSASGATIMPPPKYFPLATDSVVTGIASAGLPSKDTCTTWSRYFVSALSEPLAALITAVGASAMMIGAVVGYSAGVLATLAQKRRDHAV